MDSNLARYTLDSKLASLKKIGPLQKPPKGWIKAIREALGMTVRQLGERLNVSGPAVAAMEKAEEQEGITLARLRKTAEALDCTLFYTLVPNESLESMLTKQAEQKAIERLKYVNHTMALENQQVDEAILIKEKQRIIYGLLAGNLHRLWD